jgi:hypothetical protein
MVKPLNRTVRNDTCFVYKNQASEREGLKENSEVRILDIKKDGTYVVMCDGVRREINRISSKLVIVYE